MPAFGFAYLANKMRFFSSLKKQNTSGKSKALQTPVWAHRWMCSMAHFSLSLIISKWERQPLAISSGCREKKNWDNLYVKAFWEHYKRYTNLDVIITKARKGFTLVNGECVFVPPSFQERQ